MNIEEIKKIFENTKPSWNGDNALQGLNIIAKYLDNTQDAIVAAEHDIIYSVEIETIIEKLTIEDAEKLAKLNWDISQEQFSCFI